MFPHNLERYTSRPYCKNSAHFIGDEACLYPTIHYIVLSIQPKQRLTPIEFVEAILSGLHVCNYYI